VTALMNEVTITMSFMLKHYHGFMSVIINSLGAGTLKTNEPKNEVTD
jgi:hypothetical protein